MRSRRACGALAACGRRWRAVLGHHKAEIDLKSAFVMTIARPSVASLFLQMTWQGHPLGCGTGFVVQKQGAAYLVTNRHNLAGVDADGHPCSSRGVVPDAVQIQHNAPQLGSWLLREERVTDEHERPLWLEHPTLGSRVDVVALELQNAVGVRICPYDPWTVEPNVVVSVAQDVSIIGFPFGMTSGGGFGIWSRGTIATEPAVDHDGLPLFLIDSRTRQGQSGSPVIIYGLSGSVPMANGNIIMDGGTVEKFIGIYSGRINKESDLGFVWKAAAVGDVVERGVRPQS